MRNKQITDFTEGSIARHLIIFSVPMFLGNLLQAVYNTVDSIWVGRFLGPQALAAVSVSFPIIFALIALVTGITMATTILVSQYFGAKEHDQLTKTVSNSIILLTVFGIIITIFGVTLRRPLLELINTPPDIIDMASEYLAVFLMGIVGMFLYNVASAVLRGLGDSRSPLRFLAYTTVLNIILDPILIFGLGPIPSMGVAGAALATVIAQVVSAFIAIRYLYLKSDLLHYRPGMLRLDRELTAITFRIGLPAGIQQVVLSLSTLVVNSIVNSFGSTVIAGYGAAARIDHFAFMPAMSVGLAVSTIVGQNLGADKPERVSETVKWGILLSGGITLIATLIAFFRPNILLFFFTKDEEVLLEGARYLKIVSLSYVPLGLMFTIGGVIRGAGDTLATMFMTLGSLWIVRVPSARYLSSLPTFGVSGVWIAVALSPVVGLILHLIYYKVGPWKKRVIIRKKVNG